MSLINKSRTQTAFTVSIESKKGNSTGISAAPSTTGNTTATTTSQSSSAATAAATKAAPMFPEDMDDHDIGRLQAMLEARGFPPHLAGVLGQYSIFL